MQQHKQEYQPALAEDKIEYTEYPQNSKKTFSQQSYSSKLIELKQRSRSLASKDHNIKIDVTKSEYPLLKNIVQNDLHWKLWGKKDQKDDANIIWLDTYVTEQFVRRLKPYQKCNHFPNSHQLGKKSLLTKNINQMSKIFPKQYDFYPRTWLLPEQNQQFQKLGFNSKTQTDIILQNHQQAARDVGYTLRNGYKSVIDKKRQNKLENGDNQQTVVQQYIQKPFLIDNLKFDFRIYVLIKSVCPLKIFIYNEGLTRLATKQYCEPNQNNQQCLNMHLTNYAINKINPLFIQNKNLHQDHLGHKRSYSSAIKTLGQHGCDTVKLQRQIDQIINKTIISAYAKLIESYRSVRDIKQQSDSACFQILGFDILITSDFTPKLIEVNHSPSFCTDTPLDYVVKKYLLLDTLNLINIDSQAKIEFIKKRSMENTNKNWFRVNQIKDLSKVTKVADQIFQSQHLGGFRKIFPIKNCKNNPKNTQTSTHERDSVDTIFNKVNQQFIVKRIKQKFNHQVIDISKYLKRKQKSLERDNSKKYQTVQFQIPCPPILVSDGYKNLNFKTFSFTYYNMGKSDKKQQQIQPQNTQLDDQAKRHISPLKGQGERTKKFQVPIKMKNTNIGFVDQNSKKMLHNEIIDPVALKILDRGKVFSSTPPTTKTITRNLYQCSQVRESSNNNSIVAKNREKQLFFDSQLRERISKMKMARVRLHKIKKIERVFIGNSFREQLNTIKL